MSWTVACFCEHLFFGPTSRCPRCGRRVPIATVRPHPRSVLPVARPSSRSLLANGVMHALTRDSTGSSTRSVSRSSSIWEMYAAIEWRSTLG
jgi:hypothetical protein